MASDSEAIPERNGNVMTKIKNARDDFKLWPKFISDYPSLYPTPSP